MKYLIPVCLLFVLFCTGCEEQAQSNPSGSSDLAQNQCLFVPMKIRFNQLTEFTDDWQMSVYVDVLDQFGSRIKAGGTWRFELYEYLSRSTESRGTRLYIWPDVKLTDAKENFELWQDYLRCYKFDLEMDIDLASDKTYILQAIYFTPQGRRIIEFTQLRR
ncbi:MAG: hypothetical protein JW806_06245 [Sedimentisphaerales bacterium]|nr:hypothetical protein [Sedimentisphaerales bacterium]